MIKGIFLLPVEDNDGRDLGTEISTVLEVVSDRFGGWTLEGIVKDVYRMADGSKKLDVCERYMVFFPADRLSELEEPLREFKGKTLQEAIFLEVVRQVETRLL